MRNLTLIFCLLLLTLCSKAQLSTITGSIADTSENKKIQQGVISLLKKSDTTLVKFTRSDKDGKFFLQNIEAGTYLLLISYPKFADFMESIEVKGNLDLGAISLTQKSKLLDEVVIRTSSGIRIKGDTTEFVADSFKVRDGATVEDLLKRLPGLTVNAKGEIVAQGKKVDKVLVDGEEFFGDDPTMATQNISAKAVDRVQVFDTKTEEQKITGMTTGNEGKTVNIKLKEDAKKGAFGKLIAGTDFAKYIDSKALYNYFKGKKKISVYGTRTNVNTGSLNWQDRQKLGFENDFEYDELSGYYFSFGGGDEFNDWNLRGLPDAYTAGGLFTNKWNEDKHNLNFSYRYNSLGTNNIGTTFTQNILPTGLTYTNNYSTKRGLNQQHAVNGKYEWKIDSLASIKFVTAFTRKTSSTSGTNSSEFLNSDLDTVNRSFRDYTNNTLHNQTDNQLVYKQLFKKKNRLWQTTVRYGLTEDENSGLNNTLIRRFNNGAYINTDTIDQQKIFDGRSSTMGIKTIFTEPLSSTWTLIVDYAYNKNHSTSLRNTFEKDFNGKYEVAVPEFSNNFILDAFSHSGNGLLRYSGKKVKVGFGTGISTVKLNLDNLDNSTTSVFNFLNYTPQAQVNYTPKAQTNFFIGYRGTTRQPTINQLQPLRDNTDPLNVYIGNPDLKVGFNHNVNLGYNQYKVLKQQGIWVNLGYNIQQNAITQYNTIDLDSGKRTYYPVNVNGNNNWYLYGNYNKGGGMFSNSKGGFSYGFGMNANGGNYVSFVNNEKANTKSFTVTININLNYDIDQKFNFSFSPYVGYNASRSSLKTSIDNNYLTYGARSNINLTLPWKMDLNTDVNADLRGRINAFTSNTNFVVWNARLSKKILKKDTGKLIFSVNDILDDNKGFIRTINSTFISDDRFQRISRYFLLTFEWSFNKMPGGENK